MPSFDAYHKWLGIPPAEQPPHHYRLLAISPFESDPDVIDAAADRQMAFLRECGAGPNLASSQQLLNEVATVRLTLLNPAKKAAYDDSLRKRLAKQAPPQPRVAPSSENAAVGFPNLDTRRPTALGDSQGASAKAAPVAAIAVVILLVAGIGGYLFMGSGSPAHSARVVDPPAPASNSAPAVPSPAASKPAPSSVPAPPPPAGSGSDLPRPEPPASVPANKIPDPVEVKSPVKTPEPRKDPPKEPVDTPSKPGSDEVAQAPVPELVPRPREPAPPAADTRAEVPDKEAVTAATKLIRDLFKNEYSSKKPEERAALAKKLLDQGIETANDPAARYVLFREARDVAVSLGEAGTALSALDHLAKHFKISAHEERFETLSGLVTKVRSPEGGKQVTDSAVALLDQAIDADDYEVARKAVALASTAARKSQNVTLVTQLGSRQREIDQLKKEFAGAQAAVEKLKTAPDDAEANLTVGRFYALGKGDFERGLPYLAKGGEEELAALAKRDLDQPTAPTAMVQIGDDWWARGERVQDGTRERMLARAVHWYGAALPSSEIKGLTRTRLELRVNQNSGISPQAATKLAIDLNKKYRFYAPGGGDGGYFTNFRGKGEKNLRGKVSMIGANAGEDPWFYLLPDGSLYERHPPYHNGPTSPLTGKVIVKLTPEIYAKPSLLHDARE